MDPEKESTSISFANQPSSIKTYKLKKIFGESAAHTIKFGMRGIFSIIFTYFV